MRCPKFTGPEDELPREDDGIDEDRARASEGLDAAEDEDIAHDRGSDTM